MSSQPPLERIASEHSAEEEEEELGMLSSLSSSAALARRAHNNDKEGSSNTSAFVRASSRGVWDTKAKPRATDDEFAIDIAFVPTKGSKERSNCGIFAPLTAGSSGNITTPARRQGVHGSVGLGTSSQALFSVTNKVSLAGRSNSGEDETLNKFKGSDVLDDTDRANDKAEYQEWKVRDAQRRKDILEKGA
ncbi:hypothetical protein ABL78_4027 [Leptomonas seymouri]|uniref:Uncharacterized protein n=1 Tax=Leptomonas seymouri TaxID=5684 RepID=A0A0N1PC86_LEPSE|nr:hypothetical protein ABL78_4027 [Leptomonas seymouri]|eukprot:KPI86893.1 hypothetical protein ABL78_4027 [Leptomonas seymouri]